MDRTGPALEAAPALLCLGDGWAGLPPGPAVMGILNVTPDSFSDGGRFRDAGQAVEAGLAMAELGAAIIDVGGESTRPHAAPVDVRDEIARVVPVVAGLAHAGVRVSIDTRHARTMGAALEAGAVIVNDVTALAGDCCSARLVARAGCPVVLMHMRGTPGTMHRHASYGDVVVEVADELAQRVRVAVDAGVEPRRIALDPGIGFAKTADGNVVLLRRLDVLCRMGYTVVAGLSRKAFIGRLSGVEDPAARGAGSLAAGLFALSRGARILRVHDVADTVRAVRVWQALAAPDPAGEGV